MDEERRKLVIDHLDRMLKVIDNLIEKRKKWFEWQARQN